MSRRACALQRSRIGRKNSMIPQTAVAKSSVDVMSQTDPFNSAEPSGPGTVDTDKIMAAIESFQTALMSKIDDLQADVNRLWYDIDRARDRTSEVERRVGMVEDTTHTTENAVHTLQQQVKALQARVEDAKNQNRRNNVRILGLPERAEGSSPELFAEQLIDP